MRSRVMTCSERISRLPRVAILYTYVILFIRHVQSSFLFNRNRSSLAQLPSQPAHSHSRPIVLAKLILPKPPKMLLLPLLRNLLDLLRRKLKRSHPKHIAQALLLGTSRYGHDILVDAPTERDLAFADGVFFG